jgi:exopolysaccharide biosynthesis polyprenyl glycosylphosphotransferase
MLKEHPAFVKQAIAVLDCVLIVCSFYVSFEIISAQRPLSNIFNYWFMIVGFTGFYLYFAWTRSLFSVMQFNWLRHLFSRVIMIFVSAAILGASILYMIPDSYNSRRLYVLFVFISFAVIASEKLFLKEFFIFIRKHNLNMIPIIIFGRGKMASQICKEISTHPDWGYRIIRTFDLNTTTFQFEEILKNSYVEEVFFCIPRAITTRGFMIDPYLQICEEMGRPARVFLNIAGSTRFATWKFYRFMDRPTVISSTAELDPDQMVFKRIADIFLGSIGFFSLFICYPILALCIKITSPGPVFFRQVRVGRNGKRFIIYKFRTMYMDAEQRKKELLDKNELEGAIFKIRDDPRITGIGKFIRRFSIDELPQFINVLKGEMSLVGTRPPTPEEVCQYEKWHYRRISVRPGITGLWQVSGRNKISNFDEIVKLDLKYIDTWSLWLDFKIIFKTIFVIFQRNSAF